MSTIQDVASEASVSPSTISLVLNDRPNVRPQTRKRVLAAIQKLNYRPNSLARSVRAPQQLEVAVVYARHASSKGGPAELMVKLVTGIRRVVSDQHCGFLLVGGYVNARDDGLFEELLNTKHLLGAILIGIHPDDGYMSACQQAGIPFVVINRRFDGEQVNTINIDNVGGAKAAVEHLIEQGHRRIAHITGHGYSYERELYDGYRAALEDAGIDFDPDRVIRIDAPPKANADEISEAGYHHMLDFVKKCNRQSLPTALFCEDSLALAAIKALQHHHLKVPQDVAIVGFNNTALCEQADPQLSSIDWSKNDCGMLAADMLIRLMRVDTQIHGFSVTMKTKLVVRASSAR